MAKMDRNNPAKKGIVKVPGSMGWLANVETDDSLASLQTHVIVPRIKIIQQMSDSGLKEQFGEGTCIVRPGDTVLSHSGESFMFVPLFFFVEYCKWSDRKDTSNPMIVARSFDPSSDIAKRSQSSELRFELYEEDIKVKPEKQRRYRYVQHYNFVGVVFGEHNLAGTEVTLSFSRGEHGQGKNFITACTMRRQELDIEEGKTVRVPVPLWAQVWALTPSLRNRNEQKWFGLDFLPGEPSIIPEELVEKHQTRHLELREAFDQRRLIVDGDGDDGGDGDPVDTANSSF